MNELYCKTPADDVYGNCLAALPDTGFDPGHLAFLAFVLVVLGCAMRRLAR